MSLLNYIRMTRIHTANVTITGCILGYVIAGNPLWSWGTLLFGLFGFLYHAAGFALNDLLDAPADRAAGKLHKPLVSGAVKLRTAGIIIVIGYVVMLAFGSMLANITPLAWVFLYFSTFMGVLYNWISKKTVWGWPFICAAFCTLPLFSYYASGGSGVNDPLIILVVLYAVWTMWFQIAYEGFYKDPSDKYNLLTVLGCRHDGQVFDPSRTAKVFAWTLRLMTIYIGILIWWVATSSKPDPWGLFPLIGGVLCIMAIIELVGRATEYQRFERKEVIKICSKIEIMTFFLLIIMLQGIYGWGGVVFFIVFPIVWFVAMNRLLWGKGHELSPNV